MNEVFHPQINGFRDFLQCQHYGSRTRNDYEKHVLHFFQWCKKSSGQENETIEKYILDYLKFIRLNDGSLTRYNMIRAAVRSYYFYSTGKKLFLSPKAFTQEWIEIEIDGFCVYLQDVAALDEAGIASHRHYIARLLNYAYDNGICEVSQLKARIVRDFLAVELVHYKPSSKKTIITRIRNYFRYLEFRGVPIQEEVLKLPMSAPVWSMSAIPKTLTDPETQAVLACFDRSTAEGARDYAIAICMVELGLRCVEVASLTLDDFNWHRATVRIQKTKTHADRILPLPANVGEAVASYLMHYRKNSDSRKIFLSISRRNGKEMSIQQVRNVIKRAFKRAGITSAVSPHTFRHTKARTMFENGSCLKLIADILGHKSIDTSRIYTKVNIEELRLAACPWPEVDYE